MEATGNMYSYLKTWPAEKRHSGFVEVRSQTVQKSEFERVR